MSYVSEDEGFFCSPSGAMMKFSASLSLRVLTVKQKGKEKINEIV